MSDTRTISTATALAATAPVVRPVVIADLDYPDGPVRVCSLPTNLVVSGVTYYGMGVLGQLGTVTEGAESRSFSVTASLSGIPAEFSAYLAAQDVQGRTDTVRLGLLDAASRLVGDWVTLLVGRMDGQDVQLGTTASLQLTIESLLVDWERARVRRYTDVDQQTAYPGDLGLQYVAALQNMTLRWGK